MGEDFVKIRPSEIPRCTMYKFGQEPGCKDPIFVTIMIKIMTSENVIGSL